MNSLAPEEEDKSKLDGSLSLVTRYALHGKNHLVLKYLEHRLVKILTDIRNNIKTLEKPDADHRNRRVIRSK